MLRSAAFHVMVRPTLLYRDLEIDQKKRPSRHVKATVLFKSVYRIMKDLWSFEIYANPTFLSRLFDSRLM